MFSKLAQESNHQVVDGRRLLEVVIEVKRICTVRSVVESHKCRTRAFACDMRFLSSIFVVLRIFSI